MIPGGTGWGGGGMTSGGRGGKVKRGRNLNRMEDGGGSRFLSAEKEQELRANLERRNSTASEVEETMRDEEGVRMEQRVGETGGGDSTAPNVRGTRELYRNRTLGEELNEFDMGVKMMEVSEKIRGEVKNILSKLEEGNIDMEGVKRATREGLIALVEGMDAVMNGISDGIQKERSVRNDEVSRNEKRMEEMEDRLKENKEKLEGMRQAKEREARKESSQSLKEKLRQGERQLKYLDVDFGRVTSSRREIVEKAIAYMKEEVALSDRKRLDGILRRTRFVILGKETRLREVEEQRFYTVPIMLEFRTEGDKVEVEELLRAVGWFPVYHWPVECLEFVKEARAEVRNLGFTEDRHYIKIRPDWREGRMELKAEVKESRVGAKYRTVAVWDIPPADMNMWTSDQAKPRKTFVGQVGG